MTIVAKVRSRFSVARPTRSVLKFAGTLVTIVGLAVGMAAPARGTIIVNGGFETGDFTGWVQLGGNTSFTGVQCPGPSSTVAEGSCSASLGAAGSDGVLAQGVNLNVGQSYLFTFAFLADGKVPSDFSACFGIGICGLGGVPLLSLTDPAGGPYETFSFVVLATAAMETVSFSFRDDPGALFLDAVSVSVPEPATVGLLGIGLAGLFFARRRKVS